MELPIVGVQCLVLEVACWDKDRIGKDYMGEVDVPMEDIFSNGNTVQEVGAHEHQKAMAGTDYDRLNGTNLNQRERGRRKASSRAKYYWSSR